MESASEDFPALGKLVATFARALAAPGVGATAGGTDLPARCVGETLTQVARVRCLGALLERFALPGSLVLVQLDRVRLVDPELRGAHRAEP